MQNRPNKYKICYQNRINLWEQKKLHSFKNRKWLWLSSKNKKTIFGSIFFIQHRKSLRFIYKGFLRLRSLLRFSRSRMKQKQFTTLFNKYKRRSPRFFLFLNKLNTRLDYILYNTNFVKSVYQLRQLILHGGITVNGFVCTNPNRFLFSGDTVGVLPSFQYNIYKTIYTNPTIRKPLCSFLEVNYNTLSCVIFALDQSKKTSVPYDLENNSSLLNFISFG